MPLLPRASTLFALSLSSLAVAQATVVTPDVPLGVVKLVAYDQGSFWPAAYGRYADGSVAALGCPWLGGGYRSLTSGVNDLARLDATTPGSAEAVAMVGTAGLTLVRWDKVARAFTTTTLDGGALAQNAQLVRATPFAANHMIAMVTTGGSGVRCYRATGVFLAAPPVTGPVLDLEALRNAAGAGRLLVRNAAGITCIDLAGTVLWSVPGSDGVFARWPQSSPDVRDAWIHHVPTSPNWQLTLLGDNGQIGSRVDLGVAFDVNEEVRAAFAVDADRDVNGTIDLVVKTSLGVSVIVDPGDNFVSSHVEQTTVATPLTGQCVPDLLTTNAGRRLRLVDERAAGGIAWNRIVMINQGTGEEPITVYTDSNGFGGFFNSEVDDKTEINFGLDLTQEAIEPFLPNNTWTQVQVVAWRQEAPDDGARIDDVAESNVMFYLDNPQPGPSAWMVNVQLAQLPWHPHTGSTAWDSDALYWLTIRLCNTPVLDVTPTMVSEPVTLVTSMSYSQFLTDPAWDYIGSHCPPSSLLPLRDINGLGGGGVVGVIQRTNLPPPPPPGGIPTPSDAQQKTATRLSPP